MDKLTMAHDWAMRCNRTDLTMKGFVDLAWSYAEAMQAEADKRAHKEPRETHKNLAEFTMYPEYDSSINYPPDAWVMHKGEKRLAVSIDIKKEWQPDWSQAPNDAKYWAMDKDSSANFFRNKPEITNGNGWDFGGVMQSNNAHKYTGNWQESLRKRPQ